MKPFIVTLSLLCLVCGASYAQAPLQSAPRILHHTLLVALNPATQSLQAQDTLTVRTNGAGQLVLTLAPTVQIDGVRVAGETAYRTFAEGRLVVPLSNPPPPELELLISYRSIFADPVPENPLHNEDPTYGVAATICEQGTFLSGRAGWYPDIPGSLASFRVDVETPAATIAVTSGQLVELRQADERNVAVWKTGPLPSLSLAAGPYTIQKDDAGDIPVYTFFRPETAGLADTYLQAARRYLKLYQGLFGPYPFEKFAVVENFFPTGYGFPSWTLLGSSVVRLPFIVETSLGHEIAHSWWGAGVRAGLGGNWAEGLTTYVADHLYKEQSSLQEGRDYRLKLLRDYAALVPPDKDFPLTAFSGRYSAGRQAVGYGKAAMVFHMVRGLVGDEVFWEGLRQVVRTRLFERASWHDLAATWEALSGLDLDAFLAAWVERPGAPQLGLKGVAAQQSATGWMVRGTLAQKPPYFELAVPLRLETAAGPVAATVVTRGAAATFTITCAETPVRLILDPEADLFRRLDAAELPPTVNTLRGAKDLLVVVSNALDTETLKAAEALLPALRQEKAQVVRESELDAEALAERDLLFLGLPADPTLLPPLPPGLEATVGDFRLKEQRFAEAGAALFAALPHSGAPGRAAGLFHPLSAAAARAAAHKIPHYGKYSYLAFDRGRNQVKGTWPPGPSPAAHVFQPQEVTQ